VDEPGEARPEAEVDATEVISIAAYSLGQDIFSRRSSERVKVVLVLSSQLWQQAKDRIDNPARHVSDPHPRWL
jgi:hypothetical protein